MNQSGDEPRGASQLSNTYYEHTISLSDSPLSKVELYTLIALGVSLYFGYSRNDITVGSNVKIFALIVLIFSLVRLLARIFCGVKTESIFIVKALGLQTTTVYHSRFKSSKFIPWHLIRDVVINEAIVMQKVIFYLVVLVKGDHSSGEESLIPIFTHAQPRLAELKRIYSSIQSVLRN